MKTTIIATLAALTIGPGLAKAGPAKCLTPEKVIEVHKTQGINSENEAIVTGVDYRGFIERLMQAGVSPRYIPPKADWVVVQRSKNPAHEQKLVLFMKGDCVEGGLFVPSIAVDHAINGGKV